MRTNQHISRISGLLIKTCLVTMVMVLGFTSARSQCTPVAGTFTINAGQATAGTNFQSFAEAVLSLGCGVNGPVVFNVVANSGPYAEQIVLNAVPGTSATNTITFNGNGNTLQFTSNNAALPAGIQLDGAHHIIFDSLNITPITTGLLNFEFGYGVHMVRNADSNIIRKCVITITNNNLNAQNNEGIVINGSDDLANSLGRSDCDFNIIDNNTINGGYDGVVLNSFTGYSTVVVMMNNNQVTNNTIYNYIYQGIGLIFCNNTLIKGNNIGLGGSKAIHLDELNQNTTILENRIHKIGNAASTATFGAIGLSNCKPTAANANLIANNLLYDLSVTGELDAIAISSSINVNVYYNTVSIDDATSTSTKTSNGIWLDGVCTGINVRSNIVTITRSGTGSKYPFNANSAGSYFISDNNDYYVSASSGSVARFGSTSYATLALWQATGRDLNSVSVNPAYTSAATGNFKPTAIPVDNIGLYVNIDNDIVGVTRSNISPDPGAYEFTTSLPTCTTPPVAGTTVSLQDTLVCTGDPVSLRISGNSIGATQTYLWQEATSLTGVYNDIATPSPLPAFVVIANGDHYYRAKVVCGEFSSYSTPIHIISNDIMVGIYSINSTVPTGFRNYKTFKDAVKALSCGVAGPVVFEVAAGSGPYIEQVIVPPVPGTSAINTVAFHGNGETLSYLSTNNFERAVIKLNGASHIIFDSLKVTALGSTAAHYGFGIQFLNDADSNIIHSCVISVSQVMTTTAFVGISISSSATNAQIEGPANCDGNIIDNNTILGGYFGITCVASSDTLLFIYNNRITNNTIQEFWYYGIVITGNNGLVVEGNDISRPTRTTTQNPTVPISMISASWNTLVSKNRIHNLFGAIPTNGALLYGISLGGVDGTATKPNTISNNLIYDFNGGGAQYALYNNGSDYARFYHNTVSMDDITNTTTGVTRGFFQTTEATGIEFKNNMISIRRTGTSAKHAIYMGTATTTYASDYNNFYVASQSATNYIGYNNSTNYSSISSWRTAVKKDSNSLVLSPNFSNVSNGIFIPTNSLLDNEGAPVGISTDIRNITRSTTVPDIGAYEFQAALPVKLIDLSATKKGNDVLVSWITATEINSKEFAVEWSVDGNVFNVAGTTPAKGNSNNYSNYSYLHFNILPTVTARTIYYRIKMIDKDGSAEYSKIVTVRLDGKAIDVVSVFPNPFVSSLYININTANPATAIVQVRDIAGRLITTRTQQVAQGASLIELNNISNLAQGTYMVGVELNGTKHMYKVTK